MPSRGTVAASQYANTTEIGDRPGWFQAGSQQPITAVTALVGELNGDWIDLSATSGGQGIQRRFIPDLVNAVREVEFTTATYFSNVTSPAANSDMVRLGVGTSTSLPSVILEPRANPDSGLNDRLYVTRRNSTSTDFFDTGVDIIDQGVLYVTVRMVASSAANTADGSAEVWINGNQVYVETGINWSTSATNAQFNALMYAAIGSAPGIAPMYRSVMVNDTLTTAFGTQPEYKHVVDAEVNSVVVANATPVNGTDGVTILTDDDDTSYLQLDVDNDPVTLEFSVPASLANQPIRDVQARVRASRGNASFNDIDIDIRDTSNGLIVDGTVETVTTVEPGRENIEPILVPGATVPLSNLRVVVTNGD